MIALRYLAFTLFLTIPSLTHAMGIDYVRISERVGDSALIRQSTFAADTWYTCTLSLLSCTITASSTSLIPTDLQEYAHSFSSDGARLAVTQYPLEGRPVEQIFSVSASGTRTLLTSLPIIGELRRTLWSNNGIHLINTNNDVQSYNFATTSSTGGGTLPVGASWLKASPDGRYIAFYIPATQSREKRVFGILDTTTQAVYTEEVPSSYWDLLSEGVTIFAFSPDSKTLAYISDIKNHPTIYTVSLSSLNPKKSSFTGKRLFAREYTVTDVIWKDAGSVYFVANRDNPYQYGLYEYTIKNGKLNKLHGSVSYASAMGFVNSKLLFSEVLGIGTQPVLYDASSKTMSRLPIQRSAEVPVKASNVALSSNQSGVYMKPTSSTKTLLVWFHGGPFRQTSLGYHPYQSYGGYDAILSQLVNEGVAVLKLDYPGSFGYGRLFAESIKENVGKKDVVDTTKAITTFAKKYGYTDIYVAGNSYGGYLSLKLAVAEPTLVDGAFSINGVTDWESLLTNLESSIFNVHFGGTPNANNAPLFAQANIANDIYKLSTQRIVLAHGDKDMTVPYAQSRDFYSILTATQKNAELLTFEGEDHVYTKQDSFIRLCNAMRTFVGIYNKSMCPIN